MKSILLGILFVCAAVCAFGQSLPVKEGLWESTIYDDDGTTSMRFLNCVTQKDFAEAIAKAMESTIYDDDGTTSMRFETENGSRNAGSKDSSSTNASTGNVCRFLSKDDVSKAIGVEIIRTDLGDNGCSYFAKGTQAEMTAKHFKSMVADKGSDKKTQEIAEKIADGMFNVLQADKPAAEQDTSGEVPVFTFSLDQHLAEEQIRLNAKLLGNLGSQQDLPGVGDQAFVSADGMVVARKGKTLIRIMYLMCPCGIEQVKPLAKEIADAL